MLRKGLFGLVLFSFILLSFKTSEENAINWISLDMAQENLQSTPKPIFIDLTAVWCGWCKVMDKNTFSDQDVSTYMNQSYYNVRLDYDSKEKLNFFGEQLTARELGAKYKVPGLPTVLIISADGKSSKKLVGYKKPDDFLSKLRSAKI